MIKLYQIKVVVHGLYKIDQIEYMDDDPYEIPKK